MAMEMRQQMKLTQQLVMTPQLQQAIKLLQLSRLELQDVVQQELEENPVLDEGLDIEEPKELDTLELSEQETVPVQEAESFQELKVNEDNIKEMDWDTFLDGYNYSSGDQYNDDDDDRPSFENMLTKKGTLFDHLIWQINMGKFTPEETRVGAEVIGNIDEDGYFRASLGEVASACGVDETFVALVLAKVQDFDPMGVGARDLKECLLIQVRLLEMGGTVVESIIRDHLKDLEVRNYKQISRALSIEIKDVLLASRIISGMDPKPGRMFQQDEIQYISADIFVYKVGDEYLITLNEDGLPTLRINPLYLSEGRLGPLLDQKTETYINDKTRSALWLIKSIQQRQRTIYKTAKSIVKFQRDFFDKGIEYLKPLVLRDVADDIGMHESTISRVTSNKYMQTPQGLFELKYFFNSGISTGDGDFIASESVKNKIKEILESEDLRKPYSDQRLAELLAKGNISIARRTVTKYREMLRIGSSSERKRLY